MISLYINIYRRGERLDADERKKRPRESLGRDLAAFDLAAERAGEDLRRVLVPRDKFLVVLLLLLLPAQAASTPS